MAHLPQSFALLHHRRPVCIGHSHSENVIAAARAAGVDIEPINLWHHKASILLRDGVPFLAPDLRARLVAPVFSMIGGAVHQDVGLVLHARPFDFVWPGNPDLPVEPGCELIPFGAIHAAIARRAQYFLALMDEVREATQGPAFHVESPPSYAHERLPQDDPGFYYFFGSKPVFSPPWLRFKLWRVHSAIIRAHCEAIGLTFIAHPAASVDEAGFLREEFHGTPAHANTAYGALVLQQMLQALDGVKQDKASGEALANIRAARYVVSKSTPRAVSMQAAADCLAPSDKRAAEAGDCARRGDFACAIGLASEVLRGRPDVELARQLVGWRRDAAAGMPRAAGATTWPPRLADPFPGHVGVPTIAARALTGAVLGGAILHHGMLRVNGLISPDVADRLRCGIDGALADREDQRNGRSGNGLYAAAEGLNLKQNRFFSEPGGAWAADCPLMHFEMVEALAASGVIQHIEDFLGERPHLSVLKSTLRRQGVVKRADWHQDGAFLGAGTRSVNVWLALSECGTDAPGLDVVARRVPYIMQTGSHGAQYPWTVGQGIVDVLAQGGCPVESQVFLPGDTLLFDHFMLHRTGLRPHMTRPRWAIECWFFAPSVFPTDQVPVLL